MSVREGGTLVWPRIASSMYGDGLAVTTSGSRRLPLGEALGALLAQLMAIQDLFLAPLLAIPTALHNRFLSHTQQMSQIAIAASASSEAAAKQAGLGHSSFAFRVTARSG